MTQRLKNLRKGVWESDKSDVGEAVRDIHGFCSKLRLVDVVSVTKVRWSEPFTFKVDAVPLIVLLADARVANSAKSVPVAAVDWTHVIEDKENRVKVNRAPSLSAGESYDLRYLVVY